MVQPLRRHISKIFGVYVNWRRVGSRDWNWGCRVDQNSKENLHWMPMDFCGSIARQSLLMNNIFGQLTHFAKLM